MIHSNGSLPRMLPNMRYLRLHIHANLQEESRAMLSPMIPPSLRCLEVTLHCGIKPALAALCASSILLHLRHTIPPLESFSFEGHSTRSDELSEPIRSMRHLTRLQVASILPGLTSTFLEAIAELPQLTSLDCPLNFYDPTPFNCHRTLRNPFPSLTSLIIAAEALKLEILLCHLRADAMTSLHLHVVSGGSGRLDHTRVGRLHKLHTLQLTTSISQTSWDELQALLSCTELKSCRLHIAASFTLTNEHIAAFAEAWPRLQSFRLTLSPLAQTIDPYVTLPGLACFAQHCPWMEEFSVPVFLQSKDVGDSPALPISLSVKRIDFKAWGADEALDEDDIARLICRMWPTGRQWEERSACVVWGTMEHGEHEERWGRIWGKVEKATEAQFVG